MSSQLLRAFIDETGDRGMKPSSSTYFAFAAVVCRDQDYPQLLTRLDTLVAQLGKPAGTVLHWSTNIKDHAARRLAARSLGGLPVKALYVIVPKASLHKTSALANSTEAFYNYAARLTLERVGLLTRAAEHRRRQADANVDLRCKVTFGRVKGFDPTVLRNYIAKVRRTSTDAAWPYLTPTIRIEDQGQSRCLQWADIAAGSLDAAIKPNRYGMHEPAYWYETERLTDRKDGRVLDIGLKVLGDNRILTQLPWWGQRR